MKISISDHFDYRKLLRFAIAPITMMVFCSIYSVVDGIFVANFVGKNALAAINIIWPILMIFGSFGLMLGAGGSAEIAKTIGQGKRELAKEYFTNIVLAIFIIGLLFAIFGSLFLEPIAYLAGSSTTIIQQCKDYGLIMMIFIPLFMLQNGFQTLCTTAEKPKLGLICTVSAGLSNIIFDYFFIVTCNLGVKGAALGTVSGYVWGSLIPVVYFFRENNSLLKFVRCKFYFKVILDSCYNGISEMITNATGSIVAIIFNIVLMGLLAEDGVAAYSAIMYVDFFFKAIFFGFNISVAPIISYNYGANNTDELKNVFKRSIVLISLFSLMMIVFCLSLNDVIVSLFDGNDPYIHLLTSNGLRIFGFSYLFAGTCIFASSLFTALCNGFISGVISIVRGFILPIVLVLVLPDLIGENGVWLSILVTEILSFILCVFLIVKNKKRYQF